MLAFNDFFEALYSVGDLHVAAGGAGELLGDMEWLRQEALDLASPRDREFLLLAQLVHAENGDDVLQIFVSLQRLLYRLSDVVVFLADDARIENPRSRSQGINRGINPDFGEARESTVVASK